MLWFRNNRQKKKKEDKLTLLSELFISCFFSKFYMLHINFGKNVGKFLVSVSLYKRRN